MKFNILGPVLKDSARRLLPPQALADPVRATVWISTLAAFLWTVGVSLHLLPGNSAHAWSLCGWISLTLVFSAISEAIVEVVSRRQTATLKNSRNTLLAAKIETANPSATPKLVSSSELVSGDLVIVHAQEIIPADGHVILGIATVDESALTGESAPVVREKEASRSSVSAGTKVLSDWIIVEVRNTSEESYIDRMLHMVEFSGRHTTDTEQSVQLVLGVGTALYGTLTVATLVLIKAWTHTQGGEMPFGFLEGLALFLCLSPTTLGALLPIVGLSGMLRLVRANVVAKNAQAVEAAGNVDVLLIDKTGTLTLGDRQAKAFFPLPEGPTMEAFAADAQLASLADETPEGRSIGVLAKKQLGFRLPEVPSSELKFVAFSAQTQMSGVDLPNRQLRKGSTTAIELWLKSQQGKSFDFPSAARTTANRIAQEGGTPLVLADNSQGVLGVIALKDVLKGGLREEFAKLRQMGIKTVMITGDNPLTAATVAAEAGVDQFVAEATPEKKLALIRELQGEGQRVAMTGDGTNDAPAMAQASVAMAMLSGTQPAQEAANLIDLDSNPTKLVEVVRIGKQGLATVGALATFSSASDLAKTFSLFPALLSGIFPALKPLDLIGFSSPTQALTAFLIFNALIIPALLPLAMAGTPFKPQEASTLLRNNLVIYGIGGALTPFVVMKLLSFVL